MWELLKQGGLVMYPLGLCSLITITIFFERLWHFRQADREPNMAIREAEKALAAGGNPHPKLADAPAPSIRIIRAAFAKIGAKREVVEEHLRTTLAAETLRLSAYLNIVGTIGNLAPFIGLFGTVLGIIRAFRDIGQVGAAGPAVVATGISEALVATATGLFVAITSVIVYNFFITWQSRIMKRAEIVAGEVASLVTREA